MFIGNILLIIRNNIWQQDSRAPWCIHTNKYI
jgi:hypothetical protein